MREDDTMPDHLLAEAARLLEACRSRGLRLATAESCTGGMIAAALTAVPGSSDVVDRGFVTYSNAAKTDMLGVPAGLILSAGAVSEAVAARMASGTLQNSLADLAISVTGIAGPGGGTIEKPVGTVWFGMARRSHAIHTEIQVFKGGRQTIRLAAALHAIKKIMKTL